MPEISRFFGIVIAMYYADHAPPHFHARYGAQKAAVGIDPIEVIDGYLSPRARALVLEWAQLHQSELKMNWVKARGRSALDPIEPLD